MASSATLANQQTEVSDGHMRKRPWKTPRLTIAPVRLETNLGPSIHCDNVTGGS
jgi:hypothetical protein